MKYYIRFNSALWIVNARSLNEAKKKADEWARRQDYAATGLCITDGNDHTIASRGCGDKDDVIVFGMKDTDPIMFPHDRIFLHDWNR